MAPTVEELAQLVRGRRIVALTGAGWSTESGIPDYRGPDTPPRPRPPIQHREFVDHADRRQRYWFDRAEVLLVIGSSLTVFSGYRFVRRAAERKIPVAILNRGPTRGDEHAELRLDARAGHALPAPARALART